MIKKIRFPLFFLVVILIPILINFLILKAPLFPFVGEGKDWLGFWGTYTGAILSTSIAFYVLHKQLEQNRKENDSNRKLQINVIEYQHKTMWLIEFKMKLAAYFSAFNLNDIIALGYKYSDVANKECIKNEIIRRYNSMNEASFLQRILCPANIDEQESVIYQRFSDFESEFLALLKDLEVCVDFFFDTENPNNREYIISRMKKRLEETDCKFNVKSKRVLAILEKDKNIENTHKIVIERIEEYNKVYKPRDIMLCIRQLVDYEENKINKIFYATEQTK